LLQVTPSFIAASSCPDTVHTPTGLKAANGALASSIPLSFKNENLSELSGRYEITIQIFAQRLIPLAR
jgi:hypothetical protein